MGIHARPAAMVVRIATKYDGNIWVEKDGEKFEKEMSELFASKFQDE